MLRSLAGFTVHRPRWVLLGVLVIFVLSIVFGASVTDKLGVGGFEDPKSESYAADDFLDSNFGSSTNLVIEVTAKNGNVDDPAIAGVVDKVRQVVATQPLAKVTRTFKDPNTADLKSMDGRNGLILVYVGGTADQASDAAGELIKALPDDPNATVRAGGTLGVQQEIRMKVREGLVTSESISLPVSLVVLVFVFGGLVAAILPIAVGVTSIVTTLPVLLLATNFTQVSVHALTVASAFGLGLSIDFGLLMVSRFREERDNGKEHKQAIIDTVTTAGRTVLFSAATVTLAMMCLLIFPNYFLRSVGITASAVVLLSAFNVIVVLPALLALLGNKIDSLSVIRRKTSLSADSAFWRKFAELVVRRPFLWAMPVVIGLLALGIPFLSAQYATPDERALPMDSEARQVAMSLRTDFEYDPSQAITLVTRNNPEALRTIAAEASNMDGVKLVSGPIGMFSKGKPAGPLPKVEPSAASYANVFLSVETQSDRAQQLVEDIRGKIKDRAVEVGGPTASLIDSRTSIADKLPLAVALIATATFILLFLFTGSIVVPIKALVLNILVLSAVLGAMVWIFQYGHLSGLLGITPAPLNLSMIVLLCSIAFSLSIDYEIFLLSRIKEARDSGLSNNDAIVIGLGRVGRIVTSAALLLTITLVCFATGLSFMKMFGIGTALAVVIDATLIRGVVVPAFLRLAGEINWWAPGPLKWVHARIGFSEAPSVSIVGPAMPDAPEAVPAAAGPIGPFVDHRTPGFHVPGLAEHPVEVIPGRHLVTNANGTIIVVAHHEEGPITAKSIAARQLSALVEIDRKHNIQELADIVGQLLTMNGAVVQFGMVRPKGNGLDVVLFGGISVTFDSGGAAPVRLLGTSAPRGVQQQVPTPSTAMVLGVDEPGVPLPDRPERNGVYTLTAGTVPGQGAVVWFGQTPSAPQRPPVVQTPPARNVRIPEGRPAGPPPPTKPWLVLDDGKRFQIDRDCVIGRDPLDSEPVKRGLRPLITDDSSGLLSRAHMEVRLVGGQVLVVDLGSTNGVYVRDAGQSGWTRITPWQPLNWRPGMSVRIGGRTLELATRPADPRGQRPPVSVPRQPHAGRPAPLK